MSLVASEDALIMSTPSVTVIVPVYGDGPHLDACIDALLVQTYPADRYEIVVVDNASAPPVRPRWNQRVRVEREGRLGSYAARNRGIEASTCDLLAFTDADCLPEPQWIESGVRASAANPGRIIGGRVVVEVSDKPTVAELFELAYGFPHDAYAAEGWGPTANLFVPRAVVDTVGPFDASLQSGGDREFCRRAAQHGFAFLLDDDARVRHPARRLIGAVLRKARRVGRGAAVVLDLSPAAACRRLLIAAVPPLRGAVALRAAPLIDRPSRRAAVWMVAWAFELVRETAALGAAIGSSRQRG